MAQKNKKEKDTRFRHELKYKISLAEAERFFEDISPFCDYDPHSGATRSYEIASTYYDTSNLRFYLDRGESVGYRRKIRLRSYNTDGESKALFIEIKEKHKQFVYKKRINLKENDLLTCGIPHNKLGLNPIIDCLEDSAEAREIIYLHKRLELFPVCIVRYIRKAVIPKFEYDMRITLDTKITSGGERLDRFEPDREKNLIDPGCGVLEIKTNRSVPLWLHGVLENFAFTQTRYSKYSLGVDACFGHGGRMWVPESIDSPAELHAADQSSDSGIQLGKSGCLAVGE